MDEDALDVGQEEDDPLQAAAVAVAANAGAAIAAAMLAATLRNAENDGLYLVGGDAGAFGATWTSADRRNVLEAAQSNDSVHAVIVDVARMSGSQVDGVAALVGRLQRVQALQFLQSTHRGTSCDQARAAVDAILREVVRAHKRRRLPNDDSSVDVPAISVTQLTLIPHCGTLALWEFLDCFPNITLLEVAGHCSACWGATAAVAACPGHGMFASMVALSVGRLPKLREMTLHCGAPSVVALSLLQSLNTSESLTVLRLRLGLLGTDFLRAVSLFCGFAAFVTTVELASCVDNEVPVEVSAFFEVGIRQPFSPTITELAFRLCWLDRRLIGGVGVNQIALAMRHVKVLRFYKCAIPLAVDVMGSLSNLTKVVAISRSVSVRDDHTLEDEDFDDKPYVLGTNHGLERMCRVVQNNQLLRELVLDVIGRTDTNCRADESFPALAQLLRECRGSLILNVGNLTWLGSEHLARGVMELGGNLKDLRIRCVRCDFGDEDYASILRPLSTNTCLASFEIGVDFEADDHGQLPHTVNSIRDLLVVNTKLESLSIRGLDFSDAAVESLLDAVVPILETTNRTLRSLTLHGVDLTERWPTIVESILAMLRTNGVVCELGGFQFPSNDPAARKVHFLLKQNKFGRRFVLEPDLVRARGLWATILARVSAAHELAVMYAFLRGQPAGLFGRLVDED